MTRSIPMATLWIALSLSAAASAGDGHDRPTPPTFAEADADGDQMVTEDELRAYMEQRRADRERKRDGRGGRGSPFSRADADGDGVLNEQEFDDMVSHLRERFIDHRRAPE